MTTSNVTHRLSLFGGGALGAALALGLVAPAGAAPVHRHHKRTPVTHTNYDAELEALKARLDAEVAAREKDEAAHAQDKVEIQAARDDAAQARAEARAAQAQLASEIQTLPGTVSTAVAAAKPKPTWADSTTVGSTVFLDLTHISQSPTPNKINGTGLDIRRAYLAVDHTFNDVYSADLTLDFAPNGLILNGGTYGTGTEQGSALVKFAYVQAKVLGDALVVRGGSSSMPWVPFVENIYGDRFVEKTYTDLNKFANTTDWGAFASGKLANGLVGYSVAVVDGAGFKIPERSKGMDVEGRVNLNWNGLVAAVGGYSGKEGNDIQQTSPAPTFHTAQRADALLAYVSPQFRLGVEYLNQHNFKTVTKAPGDRSEGYSAFGAYNFTPQISVFGRYDSTKPSQNQAPLETLHYFNVGVSYEPVKVIDLALVYKHEEVTHAPGGVSGGYADANTTLAPLGGAGHYDEVGVFAQYKF